MTLVLTSTYWTIDPLPDSSVLTLEDGPTTTPQLGHCIAGQGCGTVTATYATVAPGTVALTADRTTCGEALACPVAQRHFRVVVTVR
jgi:hypothetical protein